MKIRIRFKIVFVAFLFLGSETAFSQDYNAMVLEAFKLEKDQKEVQALKKFTDAQKLKPTDLTVLYKCSEL